LGWVDILKFLVGWVHYSKSTENFERTMFLGDIIALF